METSENKHFAEDPETLEAFVLGRLDEATRTRHEQHLRGCESCQQAVQVERIIAAGIKRAGREQLKERIATLAGFSRRRQIPWPHVLSVAAVLVLLVGVGIYEGWFTRRIAGPKDVAALERPQAEGKMERAAPQTRNETTEPPQNATHTPEEPARLRNAERAARPDEGNVKGQDEKLGYAPAPTDRLEDSEAGPAGKDMRRADIPRPSMLAAGGAQEFWTNGVLISETSSKKEAGKGDAGTLALSKSIHSTDASKPNTEENGQVTVEQRPLSKLPATLQNRQQRYGAQTIQTLVRQSEGETQLTLYPASPFDSTKLHYARVQQVAPDSLVVQIGDQRIGYKLPAAVLRQGQTETGKAKRR